MQPATSHTAAQALDPRVLDAAAAWLVRLHDSAATEADRRACERWRQSDPAHARAWARAEALVHKLGGLPPGLALPVLGRPVRAARRAAIAKTAALLALGPSLWLGWRATDAQGWLADHRTATGEQRALRLPDGTRVTLNTASALDLRFDAAQRLLWLRTGEMLVETAPDPAATPRPLRVATREGVVQALGTRFTVRQDDGRTRIAVLEGAVRIRPTQGGEAMVLDAGRQTRFGAQRIDVPVPVDAAGTAWTRGMLLADGMRLADVVAELARYRPGLLRCDPAVAELRVSGAFPATDTDRALGMLVSTYRVDAVTRLRGHWVTLVARSDG
jgi:transmembrane sensor